MAKISPGFAIINGTQRGRKFSCASRIRRMKAEGNTETAASVLAEKPRVTNAIHFFFGKKKNIGLLRDVGSYYLNSWIR